MGFKIPFSNDLTRKDWVKKGLVQMASRSFWSPLTGSSKESIVYQSTLASNKGHDVTFDYSGNIVAKAIIGEAQAYGTGAEKRKFSDTLRVASHIFSVENPRDYDTVQVGDLAASMHSDAIMKLADYFVRYKDQTCFDAVQGILKDRLTSTNQTATHVISATSFDYDALQDIAQKITTGQDADFSTGGQRAMLKPYMWNGKLPKYLFVIDPYMATLLRKDSKFQTLTATADLRGSSNRITSGIIGQIGNLVIVEAPFFKGKTEGSGGVFINQTQTEESGLRRRDSNNRWTGETGYSASGAQVSRGVILGAGAVQLAFGKQPDYLYQPGSNFGKNSESGLEVWMETKKCKLNAATNDYESAKVANLDYGVIAVDVTTQS